MSKVLIKDAIVTNATKVLFELYDYNFRGAFPSIKTTGLGTGDSVRIFEDIDDDWEVGKILDENIKSTVIRSIGPYAVDIIMVTAGPVTVKLDRSYE